MLADGTAGDLCEIGGTGGVVYTAFTLGWVEGT
ncbi:hypothetical protein J2S46_000849 [Kitasatospora herbaricolor]|nr:hypothetical protein [Kitasatospora herbaricolor]